MKVIATKMGWYDNDRKRPGAIFEMADKDYAWTDKPHPKTGVGGGPRVCAWAKPFTEYQRILNERLANGWNIEDARDVETMSFDGDPTEKPQDAGPVASSQAARKAAQKKNKTEAVA